MTWRRIGSSGSLGSIRLMKYGVMSTRNLSGRRQARALLVGQLEDLLDLLELVDAVGELPAPVVPLLVGDVVVDRCAAADGRACRPAPSARAGSARLTNGASAAALAASWWATAVLISWASNEHEPPG